MGCTIWLLYQFFGIHFIRGHPHSSSFWPNWGQSYGKELRAWAEGEDDWWGICDGWEGTILGVGSSIFGLLGHFRRTDLGLATRSVKVSFVFKLQKNQTKIHKSHFLCLAIVWLSPEWIMRWDPFWGGESYGRKSCLNLNRKGKVGSLTNNFGISLEDPGNLLG